MSLNHPDEDLPELQLTLREFVLASQNVFALQDCDAFIRFVLAGRICNNGQQGRIFINARQGAAAPSKGNYQQRGDVDSAIGITRGLPFNVPLAIFPLAPFRDTLTKDNHIKYTSKGISGSTVSS
jgi:hypothetical protein